ncbi:MAG: pyruvate kinase [Myxococcales bacterium]|nr:pyruvate kinase [Myxococcales bacterium]
MSTLSQRRAKIVCTIGPASNTAEAIGELIDAGMNVARLNFSHGTHQDHEHVFRAIRQESSARDIAVAILADLQGPKIRVGQIPKPGIDLVAGDTLVLSVDPSTECGPGRVSIDYPKLATEATPGDRILMDDGNLEVRVKAIEGDDIITTVVFGGRLSARKGVNLPGVKLSISAMSDKDREDLAFALDLGVDAVALSFVRSAADILEARALMEQYGRVVPIIAKIEKPEAVANLGEILQVSNGIMVARGDLGVEMGPEEVPLIQKQAIEAANSHGKLVITATQMLDSMIRNPRPTRAEASDVANAVLDGSDAVMLSGETASGAFPVQAVRTMDKIIRSTERGEEYWRDPPEDLALGHTTNTIARAAVACSKSLPETKAIITYTGSGGIARLVSDYRPRVPILALTPNAATFQSLALYWGVTPVLFQQSSTDGGSIFIDIDKVILRRQLLRRGDRVVITFGYPLKAHRSVNLLKLHEIGESLPSRPTP